MKNILIIQVESDYFLLESIQCLKEILQTSKENVNYYVLTQKEYLSSLENISLPPSIKIITETTFKIKFDQSFNLSLGERGNVLHEMIQSDSKNGICTDKIENESSFLWSTYLSTYQRKSPFLTFHLRDLFRQVITNHQNKSVEPSSERAHHTPLITRIACCRFSSQYFDMHEQEKFLVSLHHMLRLPICDISEIDLIEDLSHTLYIGPALSNLIPFYEAGMSSIILSSHFTGFNLFPYQGHHYLITPKNLQFEAKKLSKAISKVIQGEMLFSLDYSLYQLCTLENGFKFLNAEYSYDSGYPFYSAHTLLWSYLLGEQEITLPQNKKSFTQKNDLSFSLMTCKTVSSFLKRVIYQLENLNDNAATVDKIKELCDTKKVLYPLANSQPYLAPIIYYYEVLKDSPLLSKKLKNLEHQYLALIEEKSSIDIFIELIEKMLQYDHEINIVNF